jgi:hypothetical protein
VVWSAFELYRNLGFRSCELRQGVECLRLGMVVGIRRPFSCQMYTTRQHGVTPPCMALSTTQGSGNRRVRSGHRLAMRRCHRDRKHSRYSVNATVCLSVNTSHTKSGNLGPNHLPDISIAADSSTDLATRKRSAASRIADMRAEAPFTRLTGID